jgi:uncharacterized membrane protein
MLALTAGRIALGYASSLVVFLILDTGWITLVVSPLYKSQLGSIVLDKPSVLPAIAFYLLYMAGLVFFAVAPALRNESWLTALMYGALYGFFAYITYALTNLAVLRGWTGVVAASDVLWGLAVSAITAAASYAITRWILG